MTIFQEQLAIFQKLGVIDFEKNKDLINRCLNKLPHYQFFTKDLGGEEYSKSVSSAPYVKNIGIFQILQLLTSPHKTLITLDVLGGSGQIALVNKLYFNFKNLLLTTDIETDQIVKAIQQGLPAFPQDATNLNLISGSSVDHVIIAYGFHHLPPERRILVIKEALRVVKTKGKVLLHEGLLGSTTERISTEIIDRKGKYQHEFPHPSGEEIEKYLNEIKAPFISYDLFDPQVFLAETKGGVLDLFRHYVINHYSLPQTTATSELLFLFRNFFKNHHYQATEVGNLISTQSWIKNKEYGQKFSVAKTDQELFRHIFPKIKTGGPNIKDYTWSVIIPRYAKIYLIEKQ